MAAVDHLLPAAPHKQVLGVVGHPHDFVGHDLSQGDDEVIFPRQQAAVQLHGNGFLQEAFGYFPDVGAGNLADFLHVRPMVVHEEPLPGDRGKQGPLFLAAHGVVRTRGGHDVHMAGGFKKPETGVRQGEHAGVEPRDIRRQKQRFFGVQSLKRFLQEPQALPFRDALWVFQDQAFHGFPP